jgi:hypothetical protein
VWQHPAFAVALHSLLDIHLLAAHGQGKGLDLEEGRDGLGLAILAMRHQLRDLLLQLVHAWIGMLPAIGVVLLAEIAQPALVLRAIQQCRAGWDQQADREVDGVDMLDEVALLEKVEQFDIAFQRLPGRERQQRRAQSDAGIGQQ